MILKKDFILQNLKEIEIPENGKFLVYKVKKGDVCFIYDNFDIIKRIRNIDYFMDDGIEYKAKKSFYFTVKSNGKLAFLKKRVRNSHLYVDIDGLYFDSFIKYFQF